MSMGIAATSCSNEEFLGFAGDDTPADFLWHRVAPPSGQRKKGMRKWSRWMVRHCSNTCLQASEVQA